MLNCDQINIEYKHVLERSIKLYTVKLPTYNTDFGLCT
jgi:hypothetical protein